MTNSRKETPLPVTNSGLRPGDFPVGSLQSRAAARAMMVHKQDEEPRVFIINGNEEVPDARRQDMIVRICNVEMLDDSSSMPEPSTLHRRDDCTLPEANLSSTAAATPEPEKEAVEEESAERVPLVEARRRPIVRPSLQRRRAWWRYGL